jgi:hypothetical protein
VTVERESVPELSRDLRVVVEEGHGVRSVSTVALEEGVDGHVCARGEG